MDDPQNTLYFKIMIEALQASVALISIYNIH